MRQPILSIVIANYNFGRFLEDAIQSVCSQNMGDKIELIICDGASIDNSVDIIKKYANGLPSNTSYFNWVNSSKSSTNRSSIPQLITWWCSEKDAGQSAAFNKGFSHARGKYLTWLNADDVLLPGALGAIIKQIDLHPNVEWFAGGMAWCNENLVVRRISLPHSLSRLVLMGRIWAVGGPSSFFTKRLLDAAGGVDESLHYSMDADLWYKFAYRLKVRYRRILKPVWGFRMHEDSKTASPAVAPQEAESASRLNRRLEEGRRRWERFGYPTIVSRLRWLSACFWLDALCSVMLTIKMHGVKVNNKATIIPQKIKVLLSNSIQEYMDGIRKVPAEVHAFNTWHRKTFANTDDLFIVDSCLLEDPKKCAEYVKRHDIHLLYAQGIRSMLYFRKVKNACRKYKIKILVNCHSPRLWDSLWRSFVFVVCAGLFSDGLVYLVQRTRQRWMWLCSLFRLKTYHVPNPTDVSRFEPEERTLNDQVVIGSVGVISPRKRQDIIISSVAKLRGMGYNVYAQMAGNEGKNTGAYKESLIALANKLGVNDYISFAGAIPYDEIPKWLKGVNIYMCPSDAEVMPFSILEAMASCLPIVAHDVAGIHEEVHDGYNGALIKSECIDDYAKACLAIMNDYEKYCESSRTLVNSNFSLEKYAERMRNVMSDVLWQ